MVNVLTLSVLLRPNLCQPQQQNKKHHCSQKCLIDHVALWVDMHSALNANARVCVVCVRRGAERGVKIRSRVEFDFAFRPFCAALWKERKRLFNAHTVNIMQNSFMQFSPFVRSLPAEAALTSHRN